MYPQKTRVFAVGALALALALPAGAGGAIVLQRAIGGVSLGMTEAQVRAKVGRPASVKRGSSEFGRWKELYYRDLVVVFQSGRKVTSVATTSRRERTRSGVGVGSTEAQLKSRIRGLRCRKAAGLRHCRLGKARPGQRYTDFTVRKGRVVRVVVGVGFA